MSQNTKPLTDLPSDILLQIFTECDVLDILNLSSACKQLQRMADEHQVWLHQAKRLEIPIPPGPAPSKAELKGWVISRTRVDVCWIKRRPGDLVLHEFETDTEFLDSHLIPGGEFVVFLYRNGDIGLNRIERSEVTVGLDLREVARYHEPDMYNHVYHWSKLLTETSHGCPVMVCVGVVNPDEPSVFLIDPVSQVIEKKQYMHYAYQGPGFYGRTRIMAIKDRVFFVCEGVVGKRITVVAGSGRGQVIRQFLVNPPVGDFDDFYKQVLFVSENGFIVSSRLGICLYHIPELRAVDDGFALIPIWSWSGDASRYRGTLYKTASTYPALWLQGEQTAHTLEFDVDELGCFPIVVNHQVTEEQSAYYAQRHLKLQGRKAMGIDVKQGGKTVFKTGVFGKPDLARELHALLPGFWDVDRRLLDEVKYTDLDEATGRIMVVIGTVADQWGFYTISSAQRLCLAELPT